MRYLFVAILLLFIPRQGHAQWNKMSVDRQRLLLEQSSGMYNVVSIGQINLDSSLIAASSYLKMSRAPVMLEGFDKELNGTDITWIDKRDVAIPKIKLGNARGIDHLKLLLLIGDYYAFQSGKNNSDADSALAYLFKAKKESEALHLPFWLKQTEILIAKSYLKQNNVHKAEYFTSQVIHDNRSPVDLQSRVKAYYYYGTYCPFIADLTKGRITRLDTALKIYRQIGDHTGEIITLTYLCNLNLALGNLQKARLLALDALHLDNTIQFPYTQYNEDQVAMTDSFMMTYTEMLNYAEKEVDHAQSNKVDFGLSIFYQRLASAYAGGDWSKPETYFYFQKAVDEAIRNPGFYTGYNPLFTLTDWMIQKGRAAAALQKAKRFLAIFPPHTILEKMYAAENLGYCYDALKNYNVAEKYLVEAVSLAKDPSNSSNPTIAEAYLNLGVFYVDIKKYEQARPLLQAFSKAQFKSDEMVYSLEVNLAKVDSAAGDFKSAYEHVQKYAVLQGKIFDKRAINERVGLEAKYETKAKEQSIKVLESKAKANRAELQQVGLQRNLTFGGIFALFIVSGLVYRGYRNKQRSNLLLNVQQKVINEKNASLEKILSDKDELLFEKDLLLKEVHHRVKNNLHIVMSLLESQSAYLKDNAALGAILESQNRVQAIALIHQKLYSSDNITQVDMQSYVPELIDYLNESLSTSSKNIVINEHIEPIYMDVSQAIPVGIILNEAITNAIKYAFPLNSMGEINISMKYSDGLVDLRIADNGVGFPNGFDFQKANSLGMNLMKGLINQLKGTFKFNVHNGVNIQVKFPLDHLSVLS